MPHPTQIQHPLLHRPGLSQAQRIKDGPTSPETTPRVDGRTLAETLCYIYQYARAVVFHEYQPAATGGEARIQLADWTAFFEKSLPLRVARFATTDFDAVE